MMLLNSWFPCWRKLKDFKKNEAFYLELKQKLESENLELVSENSDLKETNEVDFE